MKTREQYGVICGAVGIFLNICLFVLKYVFGTIAASVSMIADAFNNLSDAASSLVQLLGFKLSSKKPDSDHPFGHGRLEYIAGLIISFLILHMGFGLITDSINAIRKPAETSSINMLSVYIMFAAIGVKFVMYLYNHLIAKKINSVSMEATAKDSLSDMISTIVVIIALFLQPKVSFPVDGIAGIIVGLFIIKTGVEAASDTIKPLLGTVPDGEFVHEIEKELMIHKPIVGMHDLVVHDYGPGRLMISLHAEVPGNLNIFELHDVIDNAEADIAKRFNCHVVIHMDPVDVENKRLAELKKIVREEAAKISSEMNVHDIRMVPGVTHTNLIFDVVKPFSLNMTDEHLKKQLGAAIHNRCSDVNCVITVDNPFVK